MKRLIAILVPLAIIGTLVVWRLRRRAEEDAALVAQPQARAKAAPSVETAIAPKRTSPTAGRDWTNSRACCRVAILRDAAGAHAMAVADDTVRRRAVVAGIADARSQVTRPVEEAVSSAPNLYGVGSSTREGSSSVRVQFRWGADMGQAAPDVLQLVEPAKHAFPGDPTLKNPVIRKFDPKRCSTCGLHVLSPCLFLRRLFAPRR